MLKVQAVFGFGVDPEIACAISSLLSQCSGTRPSSDVCEREVGGKNSFKNIPLKVSEVLRVSLPKQFGTAGQTHGQYFVL